MIFGVILGFPMLLTNFLLFIAGLLFLIVLLRQFKPLPEIDLKQACKFKITDPKFKFDENKKYASYSVYIDSIDNFFVDFPVLFKFFSDFKFKSKIRITYSTPGADEEEIIFDRILVFENETREHVYYINDVILGRIDFEIEVEADYGDPIISFEILENSLCRLTEEYILEIKFPSVL